MYTIDPVSGDAGLVGALGVLSGNVVSFGFDFDPVLDAIRIVNNDVSMRLNPADGTLISTDTPLSGAATQLVGLAYTNNVPGALATALYKIDALSSSLYLQGNPNPNDGVLTLVGSLGGVSPSDFVGFDIESGTGTAYMSLTPPTGGTSSLYTGRPGNRSSDSYWRDRRRWCVGDWSDAGSS